MATVDNKENLAPLTSSDPLHHLGKSSPSPKKTGRKGRSKSIGPGGLDGSDGGKEESKNRRKSAFVPAVKSILPSKEDEAKRREARRKSLANRRVSFAPEATLHTWDVIEYMRDQTTSSASSESTRRASNVTRSSNSSSPLKQSFTPSSDPAEPPSTPPEQADEAAILPSSPAPQRDLHQKKHRRSSVIPPMNFNNPDDAYSSSGMSGSSDVSGSEDDQESESDEDATGTAMSLDDGIDEEDTAQSGETDSSTGSSARLEAALRQAATAAGTRGIDFDEHGDMSMELAGDEVTNALKPWVQKTTAEPFEMKLAPPLPDQENINPFSPAFKAQLVSGAACRRPETIQEEQEEDMSMDMTRAVGGILRSQPAKAVASSPVADNTMELTQAIGGIRSPAKQAGQKRRRSTIEDGSPAASINADKGKRRRSSVARSSMGDDTMDLTIAMGGIQSQGSPLKPDRRKSVAKRRSSGLSAEQDDRTREFTQAVGGIRSNIANLHEGDESFDTNEELTMELTTVLGGIDAAGKANANAGPSTPVISQSPLPNTNTTPKDQDRFKDVPDSGPKKLLTPIFEKQGLVSASQPSSRRSQSPLSARRPKAIHFNESEHMEQAKMEQVDFHLTRIEESPTADSARTSPYKEQLAYPSISELIVQGSPKRSTPRQSPDRVHSTCTPTNPIDTNVAQVDEQSIQASPSVQKQMRSSPLRPTLTPVGESVTEQAQSLHDSIKLLGSTPNKKVVATPLKRLQNLTPKKQTPARLSTLRKVATPKAHATPRTQIDANGSPVRQLSDDIAQVQASGKQVEKIRLNDFLEAAGIRFMDLETTKRRLTVAPTPSKAKQGDGALVNVEEVDVSLESAVVVGTSTVPSLDLFMHSCRELKKYISEGKTVIKSIETDSYRNTPPLIQAYLTASSERKAAIDAQLREIKTHARLRSKETWYAWRSQLLDGFMNALKDIGEGLIADDDALKRAEELLQTVLPELVEQQEVLHAEAERLQDAAVSTTDEEKEELDAARERVTAVESEMEEKRLWVEELQREIADQDTFVETREESKAECSAAIQEADRVREACRGWSISEVNALKESVQTLQETYGWSITSASSSPPTVTMSYKSHLELYFQPSAFQTEDSSTNRQNADIALTYVANPTPYKTLPLTTTLRFFLQLLRASLHALPQCTTRIPDLLRLVSSGWDTALAVTEAERRLGVESLTDVRILSDERLAVDCNVLLPIVRTKVRATYEVAAAVGEGMELSIHATPSVKVVYGERFNEKKMTEFLVSQTGKGIEGWEVAVREVRARLVAKVAKGSAK